MTMSRPAGKIYTWGIVEGETHLVLGPFWIGCRVTLEVEEARHQGDGQGLHR